MEDNINIHKLAVTKHVKITNIMDFKMEMDIKLNVFVVIVGRGQLA